MVRSLLGKGALHKQGSFARTGWPFELDRHSAAASTFPMFFCFCEPRKKIENFLATVCVVSFLALVYLQIGRSVNTVTFFFLFVLAPNTVCIDSMQGGMKTKHAQKRAFNTYFVHVYMGLLPLGLMQTGGMNRLRQNGGQE